MGRLKLSKSGWFTLSKLQFGAFSFKDVSGSFKISPTCRWEAAKLHFLFPDSVVPLQLMLLSGLEMGGG